MNGMKNHKLLSICIPTYNRASVLDASLSKIVENPEIDERVEIIVSDNCSTDNTSLVVAKYPQVKYFKTDSNIEDANFSYVLSIAQGEYLKLSNDTCYYKPGAIAKMLQRIEENLESKTPLYFIQNTFNYKDCVVRTTGLNDFLDAISKNITWIAVFGMWRNQFHELEDKNRELKTKFLQTDWSLRNVLKYQSSVIYYDDYLSFTPLTKKGGYNVFEVFIKNYLGLLLPYVEKRLLTRQQFNKEKKRLYLYDIMPWIPLIFVNKESVYEFNLVGVKTLIFKTYFRHFYFWITLPLLGLKILKHKIR